MVRGRKTRAPTANLSARTIDDKCCASPKRKDCKLDTSLTNATDSLNNCLSSDFIGFTKGRSPSITNYFHIQPKQSLEGTSTATTVSANRTNRIFENTINCYQNSISIVSDIDDNARDAFSSTSIIKPSSTYDTTDNTNIFLQTPVLHLNIDKSPNQASSIVINKHIDFATLATSGLVSFTSKTNSPPPATVAPITSARLGGAPKTATMTNNNKPHNQVICDKVLRSTSQRIRAIESSEDSSISSDSNSCDSGVVIDKTLELSPSKRRKPTTPHRILCPSPVKHAIVEKSPSSALSNLNIGTKKTSRTRRRLNVNQAENLDSCNKTIKTDGPVPSKKTTILNTVADPTAQQNTNNNSQIPNNTNASQMVPTTVVATTNSSSVVATNNNKTNTKLTDFFPVRRSVRKTKKAVEQEQLRNIETAIRNEQEDGLTVKKFTSKGRGVITTRPFTKGEFVVEYIGELIDIHEANEREQLYAKDENTGCYMYYFKHKNQQYCIDATAESGKLGRLVNHSRNGNLMTKTVFYRNKPHLVLIAKEDINDGEELTYDYGDRSKEALLHHPWLAL